MLCLLRLWAVEGAGPYKYHFRCSVDVLPPLCKGRWVAIRRLGGIVIPVICISFSIRTIPRSASLLGRNDKVP